MPTLPSGFPGERTVDAPSLLFNFYDQALTRVAEFLKDKTNALAAIEAFCGEGDTLQQVFLDLDFFRRLDYAYGQHLDNLGALVGQDRGGLVDDVYRLYIKARIKGNRSSGTANQVLDTLVLILGDQTLTWREEYPAGFTVKVTGTTSRETAIALCHFMNIAREGGVHGILEWGESDPAGLFAFDGGGPGFDQGRLTGATDGSTDF